MTNKNKIYNFSYQWKLKAILRKKKIKKAGNISSFRLVCYSTLTLFLFENLLLNLSAIWLVLVRIWLKFTSKVVELIDYFSVKPFSIFVCIRLSLLRFETWVKNTIISYKNKVKIKCCKFYLQSCGQIPQDSWDFMTFSS